MVVVGGAQNMKKPNKKNYAKPKMERWGGPSLRSFVPS